ncbi:alpha 1,2 mannosyltransferase [Coemansia erecta]|nr:alpha 1,2 mannosyltransferase [Coemansia erecta]
MRRPSTLYAALLAVRVLFALSPSYIHPDEFFQAPEVAASDILGVDALRTWEFAASPPIRSIVPIYMYSGLPFALLRLGELLGYAASPRAVFWAQRLAMAVLSLAVDRCVCRAIGRRNPGARLLPTKLLLASSHCLLVFHTRPFGNAFASAVLALCLDLLAQIDYALHTIGSLLSKDCNPQQLEKELWALRRALSMLAAAGVLGTFAHITFAPFFAPLAAAALALVGAAALRHRILSLGKAGAIVATACGCAALVALALVAADSAYYGTLTCTVLNNLRYNTNASNLALHGLHARYMHLAASMPVLFGPLYVLLLLKLWPAIKRTFAPGNCVPAAALWSLIVGTAALSLVQHQEPRFMVPALPCIVLLTWRWHRVLPAYFWRVWAAYNVCCACIYGAVHQAGVVPVVQYLANTSVIMQSHQIGCHAAQRSGHMVCARHLQAPRPATHPRLLQTNVLLYATYMAPRHLLVQRQSAADGRLQARVKMTDLVAVDDHAVQAVLGSAVPVDCRAPGTHNSGALVFAPSLHAGYERTLLVAPASADLAPLLPLAWNATLVPLYSYAPHVNFDHIQRVVQNPLKYARLNVYIVCSKTI